MTVAHAVAEKSPGPIGLLGRGGHSDEVTSYLAENRVAFYAVDRQYLSTLAHEIPLDTTDPVALRTPVHAAVGAPALRRHLVQTWKGSNYESVIHAHAFTAPSSALGHGSLAAPFCVVSAGVVTGSHVLLGCQSFVGHGTRLEDFVTLSPGTQLGGGVVVRAGAFFGLGSKLLPRLQVAEGVVLGAGAVATTDLTVPCGVYVGAPARLTRVLPGWLDRL